MPRGMTSGVAVSVLLGLCGVPASPAASSQVAVDGQTLLRVELPDLSRMHGAVQEQLREAYTSLRVLESASELEPPGLDRRRGERTEAYGELGKLLLAGDYLGVAERCFRNARLLAPDEFRWPYYLAHLFMRQGDLHQSVEHFEQALRLQPTDVATLVWLAHAYVDLGRPEAAEPFLTEAQSLYPDSEAVLFQLGRAAVAMQDYTSAVEHLEAALRLNPGATIIHYPLAMAYRGLGDLETAQDYLDRSGGRAGTGYAAGATVSLPDPLMAAVNTVLRSPQAHGALGREATANGDWPEAARQFRQAVELAPDNPVMRVSLGTVLTLMGEARAALAELEEAVRLDPRLARAHYAIGTLLEQSGREREAIDRYTAAVTHNPNLAAAHLRLADALRRTGRLDASLSSYRRVIDSDEARFGEAMALARLARYREAREHLRVAMDLHPEQPAFPHALARLLAAAPDDQVRDGQQALELVQALAKEYKTVAVAETMAMALAELGRFAQAVEWQRFAMAVAADAARPDVAQQMAANLARYQRHEPCRTPWRDDAPEYRPGPDVEPGLLDPPFPF